MTTQHDERAELPPLPEIDPHSHPEPRSFKWTENEIDWIKEYAHKYACTALLAADSRAGGEVVAWLYTLEYGNNVADTKVSLHQLNYPFGVLGADYVRENEHGVSYVRQTKLYK